jgi:hypothetical protein
LPLVNAAACSHMSRQSRLLREPATRARSSGLGAQREWCRCRGCPTAAPNASTPSNAALTAGARDRTWSTRAGNDGARRNYASCAAPRSCVASPAASATGARTRGSLPPRTRAHGPGSAKVLANPAEPCPGALVNLEVCEPLCRLRHRPRIRVIWIVPPPIHYWPGWHALQPCGHATLVVARSDTWAVAILGV